MSIPQAKENCNTPPPRLHPSGRKLNAFRGAAATLHDGVQFDIIATLRYPLDRTVKAIDAVKTLDEFRRRMMKHCYGRHWWSVVPSSGFPVFATLESPTTNPHVHGLFALDTAGKRSKADAIMSFITYAERTWRDLITGGSVWIDTATSAVDARRYFAKTLGPDEFDRLLLI